MKKELKEKEYRDAYAKAFMRNSIAFQLHAMRMKKGWSQKELGDLCGMKQNAISRLEDPDYGKLSLETLGKLAAAFDVVPWAGFISFADMEFRRRNLSEEYLATNTYEEDEKLSHEASSTSTAGFVYVSVQDDVSMWDDGEEVHEDVLPNFDVNEEVCYGSQA